MAEANTVRSLFADFAGGAGAIKRVSVAGAAVHAVCYAHSTTYR